MPHWHELQPIFANMTHDKEDGNCYIGNHMEKDMEHDMEPVTS